MITYSIHGITDQTGKPVTLADSIRTVPAAMIEGNLWLARPWFEGYKTVIVRSSDGKVIETLSADTPKQKGRKH